MSAKPSPAGVSSVDSVGAGAAPAGGAQPDSSIRRDPQSWDRTVPKAGDKIVFTGWNKGDEDLHAVVARSYGPSMKVNVSYLTSFGDWRAAASVPYDPTGTQAGSWRWRA